MSNVSNGPPDHLRPILNQVMLILLKRHGLYSAIVDCFDTKLHDIARGKRPDLEALVHKVEDGEPIDMATLQRRSGLCEDRQGHSGSQLLFRFWLEV